MSPKIKSCALPAQISLFGVLTGSTSQERSSAHLDTSRNASQWQQIALFLEAPEPRKTLTPNRAAAPAGGQAQRRTPAGVVVRVRRYFKDLA